MNARKQFSSLRSGVTMLERSMVHDQVAVAVLMSGLGGTVLAVAVTPLLGLVPALVTAAIYIHRVWTRRHDKHLREENEQLRARLAELEKDQS
jgi:hypothetical protein